MTKSRKSTYVGLAVSPAFLFSAYQAGAEPVSAQSAVGSWIQPSNTTSFDRMQLLAALVAMSPEQKIEVAGDRVKTGTASCEASTTKKSKGVCCSKSVKFQCVTDAAAIEAAKKAAAIEAAKKAAPVAPASKAAPVAPAKDEN